MYTIKCTVDRLDDIKMQYDFAYFTIRNGKAKYHLLHIPDNSCGIYYAFRMTHDGLAGRRALEPTDEIICHYKNKK